MVVVAQRSVAALVADPKQDRVWYDDDIPGFGVRVTKAGVKSFVLNYYVDLRQRRLTIGRCSEMAAELARKKAEKIRAGARDGIDPLRKREIIRAENTVADLAAEYMEKYALVNKRPNSIYEDRRMLKAIILPKLGKLRVSAVERDDVETMHASLKETPYQANRVLARPKPSSPQWSAERAKRRSSGRSAIAQLPCLFAARSCDTSA